MSASSTSPKGGYRILDEIDPVTESSWALHPQLAFYGSMLLATHWLAAIGAMNSFLLGHPRRRFHVALGVAALLGIYAIAFVAETYFPRVTWKYWNLLVVAIHLWLGYYLSEEQQWAAEMFEHNGGKIASLWTTLAILNALSRILLESRGRGPLISRWLLRVQQCAARLFIGLVR